MSERDLIEAFHDCIERLNAGQHAEDCLRAHPQQAEALAPLLATGQLVQQASSMADEVAAAQQRGRQRLEVALARKQSIPARRWWSWPVWESGWAFRLATAVLLLILLVGGTAVMVTAVAAGSLPGDRLYAVKQQSEQLQLWLSSHDPALVATFEQRRRDETRALLDLRREARVTFRGQVQIIDETTWLVDGLPLTVSDQTAGPDSLIEVDARTTGDGRLLAINVRPLTPDDTQPLPPVTPIPPLLLRPTDRPSPTATPPATQTVTTRPLPTATPSSTATAVRSSPTPQPTRFSTETPSPSETPTPPEPTRERPLPTATPLPAAERPSATPTMDRER